jgi:adenylate kinase family enzyme
MNKPKLIIITGRPGSGKSTLAHIIAKESRCPLISRDEIKEGYINTIKTEHNKISKEGNINVFNTFFNVIEQLLDSNITIIAEAAFQHKLWIQKYDVLKQKSDIKVITCKIDPKLAYKRYLERKNQDPLREYYHGDPELSIENNDIYEYINLPEPTLEVETTDSYNPDISKIKSFINNEIKNAAIPPLT